MDDSPVATTTGFLLSKIANVALARFTEELGGLGLRPKHYGVLAAVASEPAGSQQAIGKSLGLVPSAIVSIIDDLEKLGAITKEHPANSRREFVIVMTDRGHELFATATEIGERVDREVLRGLSVAQRKTLHHSLTLVADRLGIVGS